jgi:antitoxin PrlF
MMSESETNKNQNNDREVVAVSRHGQATIPKRFREKMGIDAPGKVAFREQESGEIVIEHVPSAVEMRKVLAKETETKETRSATETLHELRNRDTRRLDELSGSSNE